MQSEQEYSNLIYEYFRLKIRFQYYKHGELLPPIEVLCHEFSVAGQTVRSALLRLRAEGYISMHSGRPTKVVFRQSEQERKAYTARFFAERQEAFSDFIHSADMIMQPLLLEGFRRMTPGDYTFLTNLAEKAEPADLLRFYSYVYQKFNNPLIMNLFWELSIFLGFAFLDVEKTPGFYSKRDVREGLRPVIAHGKQQQWDLLGGALISFQRKIMQTTVGYIEKRVQPVPFEDQIPFIWRIYRDRPQVCYSLTVRLLYDIYMGEYSGKPFLPSLEKMAEKYEVSVSTVRRIIKLLKQLGTVEPINGKGIRICSAGESAGKPDILYPALRRNLPFYFQAHELLLYSCGEVSRLTLSALGRDEIPRLAARLEDYLRTGRCEYTFWCVLICIIQRCPLKAVREVYRKCMEMLLWGHPLKVSEGKSQDFERTAVLLTESLLQHLRNDETDKFGRAFEAFMIHELPILERYLLRRGMHPEELRNSTSIRLLLPED